MKHKARFASYLIISSFLLCCSILKATPLTKAIESWNDKEIIKYATSEWVNISDEQGRSPLNIAIEKQNNSALEILLNSDADPTQQDDNGFIPFVEAGAVSLDIIKKLRPKVDDINIADGFGKSALHKAAKENKELIIGYLVSEGADLDLVDNEGNTPLMEAVSEGHSDALRTLINKGVDVDKKTSKGTALIQFGWFWSQFADDDFSDLANLLIEAGADPYFSPPEPGAQSFADIMSQFDLGREYMQGYEQAKQQRVEMVNTLTELEVELFALAQQVK